MHSKLLLHASSMHLNREREEEKNNVLSIHLQPLLLVLSGLACEVGHNEARNPFIRWSCVQSEATGAPLGEQIYVLEGKKRISGGSHQRSDIDGRQRKCQVIGSMI